MTRLHRPLMLLCLLSTTTLLTGCSQWRSLAGKPSLSLSEAGNMAGRPVVSDTDRQSITVVLRRPKEPPRSTRIGYRESMVIQDAIMETGLHRKLRRMNVELRRAGPDTGGIVRLKSEYDSAERMVVPSVNYALHPGDTVVVTEDTSGMLADMLDSLGPLGRLF